jgi:hypothetical protein
VCNTGLIPKRTVYDVVNATTFSQGRSIRAEIGLEDDAVVFSFIGRTRRRKGVQMFVDLSSRISDRTGPVPRHRPARRRQDGKQL